MRLDPRTLHRDPYGLTEVREEEELLLENGAGGAEAVQAEDPLPRQQAARSALAQGVRCHGACCVATPRRGCALSWRGERCERHKPPAAAAAAALHEPRRPSPSHPAVQRASDRRLVHWVGRAHHLHTARMASDRSDPPAAAQPVRCSARLQRAGWTATAGRCGWCPRGQRAQPRAPCQWEHIVRSAAASSPPIGRAATWKAAAQRLRPIRPPSTPRQHQIKLRAASSLG